MTSMRKIGRHASRALGIGGVVALMAGMLPAQAQQQPAQPASQPTEQLQEVVVTGSLIKRTNAETAEAITILKADTLKDQGITSVEQALDQLTNNNPTINIAQSVGTFSGGGSYADLRGLGPGRTLVLLDGQRLAPNAFGGTVSSGATDLSGIPFSAIDSIEVLREGASSLYGSDAVSGVINFKTKRNFQGLSFSGTYDKPQHQGGSSDELEGTFGHGDLANDGYNILLSVGYSRQMELQASARSFSADGFDPARGDSATNNPGTWPGSVVDSDGNIFQPGFPACAGNPYLTTYFGNCAYRYSAATDLLPDHKEYSALASLTKSLGDKNSMQLQYFWSQAKVVGWAGPMFYFFAMDPASPYFPGNAQGPSVASLTPEYGHVGPPNLTGFQTGSVCPNPPAPAPATCFPSPVAAVWSDPQNNRYAGNLNTEQRAVLTFKGINAGWDWSTALNYSQNKNDNRNVGGYPDESVLAPGGVLSDLINPFSEPQTAAGQALINSSYVNGTYSIGNEKRWSVDGQGTHELGDVISAGNPATVGLGFMVGGEHFDYATTAYNTIVQAATGLGNSSVEGARTFQAAFIELDLPLSKTLDLTVSDRQDWYSDFGQTNNPKIQARWQPASFVTFRGTASTGFRAPTLFLLNNPPSLAASTGGSMGQGNPNCVNANATPPSATPPFTPQTCNTQGLGLFGGNKNLTPETSQNFDFGVVLTPVTDLGVTIDYYRILIKNTISQVPAQAIYSDPTRFANFYVLDNTGGLTPSINEATSCIPYTLPTCGYILVNSANTGRTTTDGIDLSIQYRQHTSIGTFREDLEGTATTQFREQQYTGGPTLNLVGWFNTLAPAYRWQQNLRVDWSSPEGMWGAGVGNRYWSSYIDQYPDINGNQRIVGSYNVSDAYISVKPIKQVTVLLGIKNLTDHNPPYTNANQGNFAAGYNALIVDPTQRSFYLNVKADVF